MNTAKKLLVIPFLVLLLIAILTFTGLFVVNPNEAKVMVLFGNYAGTTRKNGFFWATALSIKFIAAAWNSSSTVGIRSLVSGPVSSILWVPSPFAQVWSTPRGPYFFRNSGFFG